MGHYFGRDYRVRLDKKNRFEIVLYATTYLKKKTQTLDVYKEFEDGTAKHRYNNLLFSSMCGYTVLYPGEENHSYYYGNYTAVLGKYIECDRIKAFETEFKITEEFYNKRPDLKYFFDKSGGVGAYTNLPTIRNYLGKKNNKEKSMMETLLKLGYKKLASGKQFYKYKKENQTLIYNYLIKNEFTESAKGRISARDILLCAKYNVPYEDCYDLRMLGYEVYCYKKKHKKDFYLYRDYINMAKKVGHDVNSEYWKYPSDITKAHDKVMKEVENINKLNSELKYNMLHEVLKDLEQYKMSINGYEIFITSNVEIIKKQCDVLYQCLIRADYIGKEIRQEIVLVFFWKDGKPAYTAEVSYAGKVGQFYGDERDRNTCQAPEELKEMLNEYLSSIKLKKRKCSKKVKYYKGFSNKENGKFIGYNNYEFEVGKTYNTVFSNEEITRYGGKGCNATNKVFHFCNSIEEISKHYSPKYYCEVEPLGPVLEYNGALLSNKIKIVKEIQYDQV